MIGTLRRGPSALAGICIGVGLVAASTGVLKAAGSSANRGTAAVILVLPVVVAGMIGGRGAALFTAATAAAALNLAFIAPHWTFKINSVGMSSKSPHWRRMWAHLSLKSEDFLAHYPDVGDWKLPSEVVGMAGADQWFPGQVHPELNRVARGSD